jgi:hypothetical protein
MQLFVVIGHAIEICRIGTVNEVTSWDTVFGILLFEVVTRYLLVPLLSCLVFGAPT